MTRQIKRFRYIFLVIFAALAYLLVLQVFPKSASRFPFFVIIFLLDLYLWKSLSKSILKKESVYKYSLSILYWIPLALMVTISLISFFYSFQTKSTALYTYLIGIVLVTYSAKIAASVFILISDIIRLVQYVWRFAETKRKKELPVKRENVISRSKFLKKISLAAGGVMLGSMLIGQLKWVFDFKIHKHRIKLPNLPKTFEGFKIVQLSDLHLGSWPSDKPLLEMVEMVNDLNPDAVVFTGDLVNFSSREALKFEHVLKQIKAKYGIYTILGNHDYGDYVNWNSAAAKAENMNELYDFYQRIGWRLLRNEHIFIKKNKQKIAIMGVENWGHNPRFPQLGDTSKTASNVPLDMTKILLSHDPSHWEYVVSKKFPSIDLTLSGHTHGFQFGIETSKFKWSPAQYIYKYWAGLYRNNNQQLYVNRGTGFIGYPGRIGILPEITELTLSI